MARIERGEGTRLQREVRQPPRQILRVWEDFQALQAALHEAKDSMVKANLRLVVAIGRLAGMAIDNLRLQESRVQTERLAAAGETVAFLSHHIRNILRDYRTTRKALP